MTKYAKVNFQQFLCSREYFIWCLTTFYEAVSLPKGVADFKWYNFYGINIYFMKYKYGYYAVIIIKWYFFCFLDMLITFNEERIQMFRMFCFSFNAKIIINIVKINGRNWTATLTFCDSFSAFVSNNWIWIYVQKFFCIHLQKWIK